MIFNVMLGTLIVVGAMSPMCVAPFCLAGVVLVGIAKWDLRKRGIEA